MTLLRDTILQALFNVVSVATDAASLPIFITAQRRLAPWQTTTAQPALFQRLVGETFAPQEAFGLPQQKTMHVELWVYVKSAGADEPPEDVILPILDAIDTVLNGSTTFDGRQDLGLPDIVHHAWRQGEAIISQGELGDQCVCLIPVNILVVPNFSL